MKTIKKNNTAGSITNQVDAVKHIPPQEKTLCWNVEDSLRKTKAWFLCFRSAKNNIDLMNELFIARRILKAQGCRTDLRKYDSEVGWEKYCRRLGSTPQTINRWLKSWFEEEESASTIESRDAGMVFNYEDEKNPNSNRNIFVYRKIAETPKGLRFKYYIRSTRKDDENIK